MSTSTSSDTVPQLPARRQSAPGGYFPPRRSSTPTSLPGIPERQPTMIPIEEETVPVVVEPPKGSTLHHLPIAFALLPAAAGVFVGGGEKWTDVMLLGLAGVYLNWLVKCIVLLIQRDSNLSSMGMVSFVKDITTSYRYANVADAVIHKTSSTIYG